MFSTDILYNIIPYLHNNNINNYRLVSKQFDEVITSTYLKYLQVISKFKNTSRIKEVWDYLHAIKFITTPHRYSPDDIKIEDNIISITEDICDNVSIFLDKITFGYINVCQFTILSKPDYNISIGIGDDGFNIRGNMLGFNGMSTNSTSYGYASGGIGVYSNVGLIRMSDDSDGIPVDKYDTNDIITMVVDLYNRQHTITFYKNGILVNDPIDIVILENHSYRAGITIYSHTETRVSIDDKYNISFDEYIIPLLIK